MLIDMVYDSSTYSYLRQQSLGGYVFGPVCVFVCVCQQDYCKSNQPISLKLDVILELTNEKNRLDLDSDAVLDTDFGSLFRFLQHCRLVHFRRFIRPSIFHTVTKLGEMTDADKTTLCQRSGRHPVPDQF